LILRNDSSFNSKLFSGRSPTRTPLPPGDMLPKLPVRHSVPRSTSMPIGFRQEQNAAPTHKRWDELLGTSRNSPRRAAKKLSPQKPNRYESREIPDQSAAILSTSVRSHSDETFDSVGTDVTPRMSGNRMRTAEPTHLARPRLSLVDDDEDEAYNHVQYTLESFNSVQKQHDIFVAPRALSPMRARKNNTSLGPISESNRMSSPMSERASLTRLRSSPAEIRRSAAKAAEGVESTAVVSLPALPRRTASPPLPPQKILPPRTLQALARRSVMIARQRRSEWKTYTESLLPPTGKSPGNGERKQLTDEGSAPCYYYLASKISRRKFSFDADDQNLALALYPDSVGQSYDALVPRKASDADFWERYFFRCSEKAIYQALRRREEGDLP
jgi:BSD domain